MLTQLGNLLNVLFKSTGMFTTAPWSFGLCFFGITTIFVKSNILQIGKISTLSKPFVLCGIISSYKLLLSDWYIA